jgi:hypothetical protein
MLAEGLHDAFMGYRELLFCVLPDYKVQHQIMKLRLVD